METRASTSSPPRKTKSFFARRAPDAENTAKNPLRKTSVRGWTKSPREEYQCAMPKAAKPKATTTKRKPNAAFMKPVQPDAALSAIVGSKPLPRSELTKKLWDYIKKNKLQDAKKRTQINADDAMKVVFNGKKAVSMFEMTKLVSGHLAK